ncbi:MULTISPECIES: CAP domain-containing protein [unclassified Methanoregula]|uniref:CAP domain-containing protein n=1 Tax=unclassified Methanoregula TaxID=2649730 RepID=UPI0025D5A427|nr:MULTISPECIES: CAP domain-containing protein [unclassified Methanoregula]
MQTFTLQGTPAPAAGLAVPPTTTAMIPDSGDTAGVITTPIPFSPDLNGSPGWSVPEVPVINATSLAARVHGLVNRERQAHAVPALRTDPALTSLASAHSADMASHGYFGHVNLQERDATARGAAAGYECHRDADPYYSYTIAENLFATYWYDSVLFIHGSATGFGWKTEEMIAEETVDGWMKSPDHRENLLDADLSREGIGVVVGENDLVFITEDLC